MRNRFIIKRNARRQNVHGQKAAGHARALTDAENTMVAPWANASDICIKWKEPNPCRLNNSKIIQVFYVSHGRALNAFPKPDIMLSC